MTARVRTADTTLVAARKSAPERMATGAATAGTCQRRGGAAELRDEDTGGKRPIILKSGILSANGGIVIPFPDSLQYTDIRMGAGGTQVIAAPQAPAPRQNADLRA
eukprot:gene14973-biopygen3659